MKKAEQQSGTSLFLIQYKLDHFLSGQVLGLMQKIGEEN